MFKSFICSLTLLVACNTTKVYAQSGNKIDSLINISYNLFDRGKLDSAMLYSNTALESAELSGTPVWIAKVLINRAIINRQKSNYKASKSDYLKAYTISNNVGNLRYVSIIENNLGNLYMDINMIDSALYYFFKSVEYKEKHASPSSIISTYNSISNAYRFNNKLQDALNYARKSLDIISSTKKVSSSKIASTYIHLGNVYFEMDYLDSAQTYYQKSLIISKEKGLSDKISTNLLNLGNIAYKQEDYYLAMGFYKDCFPYFKKMGTDEDIIRVMNNIGNVWVGMDQLDSAYKYYHLAELAARKNESKKQLGPILENLSLIHQKMGNLTKAMSCLRERVDIAKELYDKEIADKTTELQTLYETEKKKKEIIAQRASIQQAAIERNNLILALITVVSVAMIGVLIFIYRNRTLKLTNERNIEKHHKEVNRLLKEQELKSIDAMIEGQDIERKRIAEDLHDRLGTTLSAAKIHLESTEDKLESRQYQYVEKLLNTAIEDTRQISHNMLSGVLTKFGLVAALIDLKETLEGTGNLSVRLKTIQFDERLETDKELNLYRIVQELVSNTLRHSKANKLDIRLEKKDSSLFISVSDNGTGFDTEKAIQGIGLKNINSRVKKIRGTLTLNTKIGAGTYTEIKVPV